jgi:hypothetical protein
MVRRVLAVLAIAVLPFIALLSALAPVAHAASSDPVGIADLVTSAPFSGTISAQTGSNGCGSADGLTFDGSYPGSAAVGTVNLNVAGCNLTSSFSGSFTITTSVGTLSGGASGPIAVVGYPQNVEVQFELTLTVMAGTGSFAGTTGNLQAVFGTPNNDSTSFQGFVTDFFTQVAPPGGLVSGVTYLDAGAYDAPGVAITKVVFELNGQVIATATPTIYGWLAKWNTTNVASAIYDLVSVATDAQAKTVTSFPVQFQVDNPMPTTAVLIPSGGASLSGGSSLLDATASSPDGAAIASVKFTLSGGPGPLYQVVIATATPTIYGWLAQWNTTSVQNGTYTLQSLVTDIAGNFVYSTGISVSVANAPPTTTVLIPSSGAIVSGTSSLLDASASANVTYLTFEISGGSLSDQVIATATPSIYGWLAQWNTTSVPDGTYSLQSVASYSRYFLSSGTSAPVTITVNNHPPVTAVLIPSNGAALSGSTTLDASASNATSVEFRLFGGSYGYNAPVLCTATPTIYGWLCNWNTTTVPNGSYVLVSEAFNSVGSTYSSGVNVTVANPGLADLANSSFTATQSVGGSGCGIVHLTFDAVYPGSAAVGNVTLHIAGCVSDPYTYAGSFTITTGVGTLSGSAMGSITYIGDTLEMSYQITLSVTTATGSFAGTTGSLLFSASSQNQVASLAVE